MNLKEATKNKCCCNCKHNRRVEGKNGISCICDKVGERRMKPEDAKAIFLLEHCAERCKGYQEDEASTN